MKNKAEVAEDKKYIVKLVETIIPEGESWDTFSLKWDILLDQLGDIYPIVPESDYDYVHSVCLEIALSKKHSIPLNLDKRALNVYTIVELNMMENMTWDEYNKTWGVYIDYELKKIHTKLFKTKQNIVTPEMIEDSKKSDGAAMIETGSIPIVDMKMEPFEPTPAEKAMIEAALGKKKKIK
jgi:hypothetical protein